MYTVAYFSKTSHFTSGNTPSPKVTLYFSNKDLLGMLAMRQQLAPDTKNTLRDIHIIFSGKITTWNPM